MIVNVVGVEEIAPDLRREFARLGDRAIFLLSKKLTEHAKTIAPILNDYGQMNRSAFPHEYKDPPGTLKKSIVTIPSIKKKYSYLVNARDWRARFIEFGVKPHTMPVSKRRRSPYIFLDRKNPGSGDAVITKKVIHPGTKGKGFMQETSEDAVVNKYLAEVISEMNNGE